MRFDRLSPVFPVRNLDLAIEHYRQLGFAVRRYEGADGYAFAARDGIDLHLAQVDDLKPKRNMSAVYLYVDDADPSIESGVRLGSKDAWWSRLIRATDFGKGRVLTGTPTSSDSDPASHPATEPHS